MTRYRLPPFDAKRTEAIALASKALGLPTSWRAMFHCETCDRDWDDWATDRVDLKTKARCEYCNRKCGAERVVETQSWHWE